MAQGAEECGGGVSRFFAGLAALWCEWTHGGGWVMRDPAGRVNWQCHKCGRWAEPVNAEDERLAIDEALNRWADQAQEARLAKQKGCEQ